MTILILLLKYITLIQDTKFNTCIDLKKKTRNYFIHTKIRKKDNKSDW